MRRHSRPPRFVIAVAVSLAGTLLWALPLVLHLNSRVLGGPSDATSTIRDYWYASHVGETPFTLKRDMFLGAPEGVALSPGIQVANGFQPAVVWTLKGMIGLVAAWNVFILAGIVLTAACTWLLLDMVGVGAIPAFFGSYAFTFSGYLVNTAYAGHAGLAHAWILPLLLIVLLRARERRRWTWLAAAGLLAGLAFYIHTYYGFMSAFLVAVFLLTDAVWESGRKAVGPLVRRGIVTGGFTILALLPAEAALHLDRGSDSPTGQRSIQALQQFGAKLTAYFAPSQESPLGHIVPHSLLTQLEGTGEPSLFFGFTTLVLAALYVRGGFGRPGLRKPFLAVFATALVASALIMSMPRLFSIGPVHLPMPSWFIGHVTTAVRVYARFGVLVGLGLIVLAALMIDQLRARGRWVAPAIALLLVLELTPSAPAKTWVANNPPPSDVWLAKHPGGTVAIYPLLGDQQAAADLNGVEYYYQRFQQHPLFSGITSSMDPGALALRTLAQYFTHPETEQILSAEHVKYVVLRDDVYRAMHQRPPNPPSPMFRLVSRLPGSRIYVLRPRHVDLAQFVATHRAALATAAGLHTPNDVFGSGFYPPEMYSFYTTPWRWMSQEGHITVKPDANTRSMEFQALAFANKQAQMLTLLGPHRNVLGVALVRTSMTQITIGPFRVRPGSDNTFTLEASPGPQLLSPNDNRNASVYLNEPAFQPTFIPGE